MVVVSAYFVILSENSPALAMAGQSPLDLGILKLRDTEFTGVGTVRLVEDILGRNSNVVVGQLAGQQEVNRGRGDDNLGVGVEFGRIEVLDNAGDTIYGTIPAAARRGE